MNGDAISGFEDETANIFVIEGTDHLILVETGEGAKLRDMVLPLLDSKETIELHLSVARFEDALILLKPFLREFPDDEGDDAIEKDRADNESEHQNGVEPRHILELRIKEDV